eukprot:gene19308-38589_t
MLNRREIITRSALASAGMALSGLAFAQTSTTRIIVPFAAGGPIDVTARILAEAVKASLGTLAGLGMQRRALHVAMADRPDLRLPALDPGVVGRCPALGSDPQDLADVVALVLRLVALAVAVADRDEERACPVEDQPRAEMQVAGD